MACDVVCGYRTRGQGLQRQVEEARVGVLSVLLEVFQRRVSAPGAVSFAGGDGAGEEVLREGCRRGVGAEGG